MSLHNSVRGWIRVHGFDAPAARPNHLLKCLRCNKRASLCGCTHPEFVEMRLEVKQENEL